MDAALDELCWDSADVLHRYRPRPLSQRYLVETKDADGGAPDQVRSTRHRLPLLPVSHPETQFSPASHGASIGRRLAVVVRVCTKPVLH